MLILTRGLLTDVRRFINMENALSRENIWSVIGASTLSRDRPRYGRRIIALEPVALDAAYVRAISYCYLLGTLLFPGQVLARSHLSVLAARDAERVPRSFIVATRRR